MNQLANLLTSPERRDKKEEIKEILTTANPEDLTSFLLDYVDILFGSFDNYLKNVQKTKPTENKKDENNKKIKVLEAENQALKEEIERSHSDIQSILLKVDLSKPLPPQSPDQYLSLVDDMLRAERDKDDS